MIRTPRVPGKGLRWPAQGAAQPLRVPASPPRAMHRLSVPRVAAPYRCMSTKRLIAPWKATGMTSVAPLRCLATMKSASPALGDDLS